MLKDNSPDLERQNRLRILLNEGKKIAGEATGIPNSSAIDEFLQGSGGVVGVTASMAVQRIGDEILSRQLGPREAGRVGRVVTLAASGIVQRCKGGEKVRDDGFFKEQVPGRSDAEEVWESVLLKSQREPEEKKLPYMAHLLENLAFDTSISVYMAHQITKAAELLTYRQLCLLKLSLAKDHFNLRKDDYRGQHSFDKNLYQILYEYLDLYVRGFVNFGGEVVFGPTDIKPGSSTVQGLGADIHSLMCLDLIPDNDLTPIVVHLK